MRFAVEAASKTVFGKVASCSDVANVTEPFLDSFAFPLSPKLELLAQNAVVFSVFVAKW